MLPGPSGRPRRASQCGTAWAEVPARCQGFVCHARSTPAIACTRHTTRPGVQGSPTYTFHPYIHPSPTISSLYVFTSFSPLHYFSPWMCVRSCRLIGDALCAICSNPPTHLPPFPLITRVGLTICVPVCSHSAKKGDSGGSWWR